MPVHEPVLRVSDLRVSFPGRGGEPVNAVRGVDLSLRPGEILGLVGESGSGKSLTGFSILGLLSGNARVEGSVAVDGREVLSMSSRELRELRGREISMIFQEPMSALNPVMTVGNQIAEVCRVHGLARGAEARRQALTMLKAVRVPDPERRMDEFPHELSGGMRQRVVIAMALAGAPRIVVADEPTTALDVTIQAQILSLMLSLRDERGMSILLISHNLGVIARTCDTLAVMYAGRIVESGTVREVMAHPRHPYTRALIDAAPRMAARRGDGRPLLPSIPGSVPALSEIPAGCAFAPRCTRAGDLCSTQPERRAFGTTQAAECHHPLEAPYART